MQTLTQHPLSAAFPAMQADEFQDLQDSINIIGVQNPITLLDGMVLDGWHRYCITIAFGMACPMVELPDDIDPVDFVKAQNSARRHLTRSQTAFAYTQLYAWCPPHRPNKSAPGADLSKSTKELAAMAGVGVRTIEHAKAVCIDAVPSVQDAVKAGAVSVKVAAAVARLPPEEQEQIAVKGPEAIRAAAKSAARQASGKVASSGNSSTQPARTQAQAQAQAAQIAQDAHGDDADPVALLEEALAENEILRKELATLVEADDQKAETLKWRRVADVAQRRQNELMDTVNAREKELQRMASWLRRIGAVVGETNPGKIAAKVEATARAQMVCA